MALSASCVNCHRTVQVKSELAGKTVRCPRCGSPVSVPATAAQAKEPSPDRPSQGRATATPAPPSRRSSHEMAQRSTSKSDAVQRISGKAGATKPQGAAHELGDNDPAYVPRLKKRRGPNVIATALVGAWESLGDRRREYSVGLAIVVAIVALQLVYGGWFSSAKPSGPPVGAAEEATDNEEPPAKKGPVPVVIVDAEKKKDEADNDGDKDANVKATLKRTTAGAGKNHSDKADAGQQHAGILHPGKRPSASALAGQNDPQRTLPAPSSAGPAPHTIPTVKTDHSGAYNAAAPPQVGEVVVARLRDGLHVAKVSSVDVAELQCEIIVLDAGAYHKRGQIKETSRTDTVRFGQMRPPTFLKNRALPPDFGPPAM